MDDQLDVLNERERDFVDDMAWKLRISDPAEKQVSCCAVSMSDCGPVMLPAKRAANQAAPPLTFGGEKGRCRAV